MVVSTDDRPDMYIVYPVEYQHSQLPSDNGICLTAGTFIHHDPSVKVCMSILD